MWSEAGAEKRRLATSYVKCERETHVWEMYF